MAMQGKSYSEPRYTIEQISLLHRLIRTGLTKHDIIHALDSMTKMDAELQSSNQSLMGSAGDHSSSYDSSSSQAHVSSGQTSAASSSSVHVCGLQKGTGGGGRSMMLEDVDVGNETQVVGGILQGMSQEVTCGVENFQNVADEEVENLFR